LLVVVVVAAAAALSVVVSGDAIFVVYALCTFLISR
jgi:hypothetical protein